jgi:hypothetical protein
VNRQRAPTITVKWIGAHAESSGGVRRPPQGGDAGGVKSLKRRPAGAGAMLVACRLAGLSALEPHYAGIIEPTQSLVRVPACRVIALETQIFPFRPVPATYLADASPEGQFLAPKRPDCRATATTR